MDLKGEASSKAVDLKAVDLYGKAARDLEHHITCHQFPVLFENQSSKILTRTQHRFHVNIQKKIKNGI